jgi:hypothetical protein
MSSKRLATLAAISTAGLLAVPFPAAAIPMVPLAPACEQWTYTGTMVIDQSNGGQVHLVWNGLTTSGQALWFGAGGDRKGTSSGGVNKGHLDFSIAWQGAPGSNRYTGDIRPIGASSVLGDAYGKVLNQDGGTSDWVAHEAFKCADAPKPPPAAPPPEGPIPDQGPKLIPATVVGEDVDVYDVPGGKGKIIGMLKLDRQVQIVGGCSQKDWCQVVVPELPDKRGWVWGHLKPPAP